MTHYTDTSAIKLSGKQHDALCHAINSMIVASKLIARTAHNDPELQSHLRYQDSITKELKGLGVDLDTFYKS